MVDETTPDPTDPTDPSDPPADPPPATAYLVTYSRPGRYVRYAVVNAYTIDQAWEIAWANCAGSEWTPTRIILQPVWIGNSVHPEGPGSVAAES